MLSLSSGQDRLHAIALDAEERIVAAGYVSSTITGKDMACVRFLSDGTLDTSFGVDGVAAFDLQLGSDDIAFDVVIQSDGKIVLAGSTDDGADKNAALVRIHENGSLDLDFGLNGMVISDLDNGLQDEFRCLKLHPITGNLIAEAQLKSAAHWQSLWLLGIFLRVSLIQISMALEFACCGLPTTTSSISIRLKIWRFKPMVRFRQWDGVFPRAELVV